jgi:CheY-like chemotaxis protein
MVRAFEKAGIKNPVRIARNGEEAVNYLSGQGQYSDRDAHPLPELVLLDLKLPQADGFDVLRWIRTNSQLSSLRVVVLTSSEDIRDVNLAYSLGANSFLVKPMDFTRYVELSSFIADAWFLWSKTPSTPATSGSEQDWAPSKKKVLLRNRDSKTYYAARSTWVSDKQGALDFERIELAEAVATAKQLNEVEIVLAYDHPLCELSLPVLFPSASLSPE